MYASSCGSRRQHSGSTCAPRHRLWSMPELKLVSQGDLTKLNSSCAGAFHIRRGDRVLQGGFLNQGNPRGVQGPTRIPHLSQRGWYGVGEARSKGGHAPLPQEAFLESAANRMCKRCGVSARVWHSSSHRHLCRRMWRQATSSKEGHSTVQVHVTQELGTVLWPAAQVKGIQPT